MNRADLRGAEQIAQIGRDRREAAAVHAEDDDVAADEQRDVPRPSGHRHQRVEHRAEEKERRVRRLAANEVRQRRPADRPAMFARLSSPTNPAAAAAVMRPGNIS